MEKGQKLTAAEFISYCWEVVAWNKVSRGDHDFTTPTVLKQLDYCLEEIQETVKGYEDDNLVEILDGLSDSMVTLSYLLFLCREGKKGCFDCLGEIRGKTYHSGFHSNMEMNYRCLNQVPCVLDVESALGDVLAALNDLSEKANIVGVVEEVLDSNWSKFPYLDQVIPMEECKWIEVNRGKEGVYHVVIGNKVVFRDKGGKIVKPSTFKEPDIQKHIYEESSNVTTNVSQEIKIGTILQVNEWGTGLEVGEFYEVMGIDESFSLSQGDVIYEVREVNDKDSEFYSVSENWVKQGLASALEGDIEDEHKVDISGQVAKVRDKINQANGADILDIVPLAVSSYNSITGQWEVNY